MLRGVEGNGGEVPLRASFGCACVGGAAPEEGGAAGVPGGVQGAGGVEGEGGLRVGHYGGDG